MKQFSIFCLFLLTLTLQAQVTNEGTPASWNKALKKQVAPITMPAFNLDQILNKEHTSNIGDMRKKPLKFGHKFDVNYNTFNAGAWETLPNGDRIWRIHFISKGAKSINFLFDYFYLPEGGKVYLYNNDKTDLIGAYTASENQENGELGTWIVHGDHVWIEYFEPANKKGLGRLNIDKVIHGYKAIGNTFSQKINESGLTCNVDVMCNPGGNINWVAHRDNIRHAVAQILINGNGLCTGTLVNNVTQDGTPYLLTAHHCLNVNNDGVANNYNANNWAFGFQWFTNTPQCATGNPTQGPNTAINIINGAQLRANRIGSDVALFQLNQAIPAAWNLYFAGWDNTNGPSAANLGVHHPNGDIMKLCRNDVMPASQSVTIEGQTADSWVLNWELGTTQGGSSGSCLLDQNGRIIGQLFGGASGCQNTNPNGQTDVYGRFGTSWNTGPTANTRLRDWLDPNNTAPTTLNGAFLNQILTTNDIVGTLEFAVYPNPSTDHITISHQNPNDLQYALHNTLGQHLKSGTLKYSSTILPLGNYTPGIYYLTVKNTNSNETATKKLVIR